MPNLKLIEIALILLVSSGMFAGIYLAVRLARRSSSPTESS